MNCYIFFFYFLDFLAIELGYFVNGDLDSYQRPITREEMAVVLVNVLRRLGKNVEVSEALNFADSGTASNWALEAIRSASGLGLVKGYETGEFMPKNNIKTVCRKITFYTSATLYF